MPRGIICSRPCVAVSKVIIGAFGRSGCEFATPTDAGRTADHRRDNEPERAVEKNPDADVLREDDRLFRPAAGAA